MDGLRSTRCLRSPPTDLPWSVPNHSFSNRRYPGIMVVLLSSPDGTVPDRKVPGETGQDTAGRIVGAHPRLGPKTRSFGWRGRLGPSQDVRTGGPMDTRPSSPGALDGG